MGWGSSERPRKAIVRERGALNVKWEVERAEHSNAFRAHAAALALDDAQAAPPHNILSLGPESTQTGPGSSVLAG